jgi:hypothetical protein
MDANSLTISRSYDGVTSRIFWQFDLSALGTFDNDVVHHEREHMPGAG